MFFYICEDKNKKVKTYIYKNVKIDVYYKPAIIKTCTYQTIEELRLIKYACNGINKLKYLETACKLFNVFNCIDSLKWKSLEEIDTNKQEFYEDLVKKLKKSESIISKKLDEVLIKIKNPIII